MLLELTVAEQRFNAVMEVIRDGLTVIEVADRCGVSRQAVHSWLRRYASGAWTPWPTAPIAPIPARTRCQPRSRRACVSCAGDILTGASADSPMSWSAKASTPYLG